MYFVFLQKRKAKKKGNCREGGVGGVEGVGVG